MIVLLVVLLWVAPATAATPRSLLATIVARVCPNTKDPLERMGEELATATATGVTNGPTSLAAMGGALDSPASTLGPIFLDSPRTVGRGQLTPTLLSQTFTLGQVNGRSLDPPSQDVVFDQPPVVAARVTLDARIRQAATGLALSLGVTDDIDVSVLLPLVFTRVRATATRQITDVLGPNGKFVPVKQPTIRHSGEASGFSQGDLTVRGKYWLTDTPFDLAVTLAAQFPTGVPELLTGTGDYWIDPGLAGAWPFWNGRAEVTASLGFLIDLSKPNFSRASYGIGVNAVVIPQRLGLVVEVIGQSDLTSHFNPDDVAVLTLRSDRSLLSQPALQLFFDRIDQVNLSVGFRVPVAHVGPVTLLAFATALVPLNEAGLRPSGAFLTLGMSSAF